MAQTTPPDLVTIVAALEFLDVVSLDAIIQKALDAKNRKSGSPGGIAPGGQAMQRTLVAMRAEREQAHAARMDAYRREDSGTVFSALNGMYGHGNWTDAEHQAATELAAEWRQLQQHGVKVGLANYIADALRRQAG